MRVEIKVFGKPQPAGSKRGFAFTRANGKTGVAISDANSKSRPWKTLVSQAAGEQYGGELLRGPLAVELRFFAPRPKGHYGSGSKASVLKASAPQYPTGKPDVLKLARAVEDALTKVVYADDSQIVREVLEKCYGEPARVEIVIVEAE